MFLSADAAPQKENREESTATDWCFKVCCRNSNVFATFPLQLTMYGQP
jgi:hypothetical protein